MALARCTWSNAPISLYAASTGGVVCCLDPETGEIFWQLPDKELAKFSPSLLSSLTVQVARDEAGDRRRLYFASGVNAGNGAVVFCLEDQWQRGD
jgi:hypothetical protein